jgi:hypothetical protein
MHTLVGPDFLHVCEVYSLAEEKTFIFTLKNLHPDPTISDLVKD